MTETSTARYRIVERDGAALRYRVDIRAGSDRTPGAPVWNQIDVCASVEQAEHAINEHKRGEHHRQRTSQERVVRYVD